MKLSAGNAVSQYISTLEELRDMSKGYIGRAIYEGAKIVADKIKEEIDDIPKEKIKEVQREGLKEGLGIAKMQENDGMWNVKIGFDGYNKFYKSWRWEEQGQPNAMIARAIERGTYFSHPYPFIQKGINKSRRAAEKKMKETVDQYIEVVMANNSTVRDKSYGNKKHVSKMDAWTKQW